MMIDAWLQEPILLRAFYPSRFLLLIMLWPPQTVTLVNAFQYIKIMDMKLMLLLMQMPQRLYLMLHAMLILLCRTRATNLLTWS